MKIKNEIFFAVVEERLAAGERVTIELVGTSMQPTLINGDLLTLEPYPSGTTPQVGDIVLFRYRGQHLLHRITAIRDGHYTMQGDNCLSTESASREDIVARLATVKHRHPMKRLAIRWLGHKGRKQLRPWYFLGLAFLMWAPLNGVGIPLDNYVLGLRMDHLLHASVYVPCTFFLMDLFGVGLPKRPQIKPILLTWLTAVGIGLLTESVQKFLPRKFDINDLIANVIGITLGWLVILAVRKIIHSRRQKNQQNPSVTV